MAENRTVYDTESSVRRLFLPLESSDGVDWAVMGVVPGEAACGGSWGRLVAGKIIWYPCI